MKVNDFYVMMGLTLQKLGEDLRKSGLKKSIVDNFDGRINRQLDAAQESNLAIKKKLQESDKACGLNLNVHIVVCCSEKVAKLTKHLRPSCKFCDD